MPNIFLTNLRSIRNKFDDFYYQLLALNADIAVCTETWLSSCDPIEAYSVNGYNCFRADRANDSGHGGVALWIKSNLRAQKMSFLSFDFLEICAIQIFSLNLIVIGVYLPPGIARSVFRQFCDCFIQSVDGVLNQLPDFRLIVAGDFNQYDRSFLSLNLSLCNIVTGCTRLNANLDLIFVDKRVCSMYDPKNVVIGPPIGSSDHRSVFVATQRASKKRIITKHVIFDLRLSNILAFEQRFLSHDFSVFYSSVDIEEKCKIFYEFMNDAICVLPQHVVFLSSCDQPWMTPFIKYLINSRWHAYRNRNWTLYNKLKFQVRQEIWQAKQSYFTKKSKSVRGLWSYVNMERGASKRYCSPLVGLYSSMNEVLTAFNDYFCSVMHPPSDLSSFADLPDDGWSPTITIFEVWQSLRHLPCKATGSDDIPTKLYKKSALILAQPLHHLIVECIRQRRFPSSWKIADVIPAPKSSGTSIEDHRPVSLLPIPAKLTEKFILRNLKSQFSNLLGDDQFGVRKNSSTTHAIIATHDILTRYADDLTVGASVFIAFDFSKAFDRIVHRKLILRALELSLPSGFIRLLTDYLSNRQQRVRVNGLKSDFKSVTSGVPQGSLLGPYLFGLYIACLQPLHSSTNMVKYVDDVSLVVSVRKSHTFNDLAQIQSEIEHISQWSSNNDLALNTTKTSGLICSRGSFKELYHIEATLDKVCFKPSVKFLGVIFDDNLRWKSHVDYIVKKCSQRLYILRRLKSMTSNEDFFRIYCGLIRSLIEYACPAFIGISSCNAFRLQALQKRCLKIKGILDAPDLSSRRQSMAVSIFRKLPLLDTFLKRLLPFALPSGRLSVPLCRTSLRRDSFIPHMCIEMSGVYCD